MKRLLALLSLLCACNGFGASFITITMTFTNLPTNSCTFTIAGSSVTWTTAPLNSTTWIQSNSIAGSATNLTRRLGAQWPQYFTKQTNSTNVIISGSDLQFSITGNYGFTVTNTLASNTNRILLDLPFDYMFETNRTNAADALVYGIGLYARTNSFPTNSQAMTNFVNTGPVPQTFGNKVVTNSTIAGGTLSTNVFTNAIRMNVNLLVVTNIKASAGELNGVNITNAPWIKSDSNRFDTVIVSSALVATNASFPGTGANSQKVGSGSTASGAQSVAIGKDSIATNTESLAVGTFAQSFGLNSVAVGSGAKTEATGLEAIAIGVEAIAAGTNGIAIGANAQVGEFHANSVAINASSTETNQIALGGSSHKVSIAGELQAAGTTKIVNAVRYAQSGPWTFTEGAYTAMTGGSNNVVALATNAWTRISGHVSACNLNSLRQGAAGGGDGLPMAGRRAGIINGGSFDITLIDTLSDGFETLATNELDLGGVNITLAPKDRAEFIYSATSARWEILYPKPPTNLLVKTTGDFAGTDTTNVFAFNAQQMRRMTNAMTTNHTFIVSNIIAGTEIEIYVTGANGGVIASNYVFTLRTNSLPTASRITWVTATNGSYDVAVSSNKWGKILLTAPFATNVFARYEEGP